MEVFRAAVVPSPGDRAVRTSVPRGASAGRVVACGGCLAWLAIDHGPTDFPPGVVLRCSRCLAWNDPAPARPIAVDDDVVARVGAPVLRTDARDVVVPLVRPAPWGVSRAAPAPTGP